jgi:putative two-component system response regulator
MNRDTRHVLVVDDEPDIRETAVVLLEVAGIPAVAAADGREALELLRAGPPPAVVLLDLLMPGMSGPEFLAERAADPALAAVPVVVCSAATPTDPRAPRVTLSGVDGYLDKPADPTRLVEAARRFVFTARGQTS